MVYYILFLLNIMTICTVGYGENYCTSSNCKNNKQLCKFQQSHNPARHCLELEKLIKTDNDSKAILDKINSRRSKVASGDIRSFSPAADMFKLEWNTKLQMSAQRWVDQCVKSSTPDVSDGCRDLEGSDVGQNIASVYGESPGLQPTALVDVWFMELLNVNGSILPRYRHSSDGGLHHEFFTQLVWANTREVGCGGAKFKERVDTEGGKNRTVYRLVCNFWPAGNREDKPVYSLGPPCSDCPEGTACDTTFRTLCSHVPTRNVQEESNKTDTPMKIVDTTEKDETENTNVTATESDENYNPFDYFSHLHEFTRQTITVITSPKPECKDVLAVDDFIDLIKKRLSNDHIFKELIFATKTTQGYPEINFTDPNVAAFIQRVYSKKDPSTTLRSTENEMLNSTLLVDLVEAVIFRSGDKVPPARIMEQSTISMSDISPIKIQAELAQVRKNEDFTGHYFFPEDDEEVSSSTETTESYYDLPSISISDVIMEIEDIRKSTVTKNFLDDILESESSADATTTVVVLSPDDMTAHKSGHEIMKKFLEDIKDKTGGS